MKTFLISILLTFTAITVNAQIQQVALENFYEVERPKHVYYKDVNNQLNKYVGTWEYNQNGHYFKITFFKQTNFRVTPVGNIKITIFTDRIYGYYQYKVNNNEIYNVSSQDFTYSTMGAFFMGNFRINFKEPSTSPCGRPLMGEVTLGYSNVGGVEKLTWSRTDRYWPTFCQQGQVEDETPFQTPANMVLTKID